MSAAARRLAAWGVHGLTAGGAALGLLAIQAITAGRFKLALALMGAALVIDGLDGPLARWLAVDHVLPVMDGALLDNLVDYLSYVVVPAWFLHRAELLPAGAGLAAAGAICFVSALQFSRRDAKTADHYFTGFPSYWNLLVLYLLVLRPDPRIALAVVAALCLLALVPLRYVHPNRTRPLRSLTRVLTGLWAGSLLAMLVQYPDVSPWLVRVSLAYVVYYFGLGLALGLGRRRTAGEVVSP